MHKAPLAWPMLGCMLLTGCSSGPLQSYVAERPGQTAEAWVRTLRSLQMEPVLPLREDLKPGDVFAHEGIEPPGPIARDGEGRIRLTSRVRRLSLPPDSDQKNNVLFPVVTFNAMDAARSSFLFSLDEERLYGGLTAQQLASRLVHVRIDDAFSERIDAEQATQALNASRGDGRDRYQPPFGGFVRVVTEVFYARKITVQLGALEADAFGGVANAAQNDVGVRLGAAGAGSKVGEVIVLKEGDDPLAIGFVATTYLVLDELYVPVGTSQLYFGDQWASSERSLYRYVLLVMSDIYALARTAAALSGGEEFLHELLARRSASATGRMHALKTMDIDFQGVSREITPSDAFMLAFALELAGELLPGSLSKRDLSGLADYVFATREKLGLFISEMHYMEHSRLHPELWLAGKSEWQNARVHEELAHSRVSSESRKWTWRNLGGFRYPSPPRVRPQQPQQKDLVATFGPHNSEGGNTALD